MRKDQKEDTTQSVEDMQEMQKHMMDPGYYVGTGRVRPDVSAPGNPKPLGILYILGAVVFFALGLVLLFSNDRVTVSGRVESLILVNGLAVFFLIMGLGYFRKAKNRTKKSRSAKRRK